MQIEIDWHAENTENTMILEKRDAGNSYYRISIYTCDQSNMPVISNAKANLFNTQSCSSSGVPI